MNASFRWALILLGLCSACADSCACGSGAGDGPTGRSAGARRSGRADDPVAVGATGTAGSAGAAPVRKREGVRDFQPLEDSELRRKLEALAERVDPEAELGKPAAPKSLAGVLGDKLGAFKAASPASNAARKVGEAVVPVATRDYRSGKKSLRMKVTDTAQAAVVRQAFTEQLLQVGNEVAGGQRGAIVRGSPAVHAFHGERRTSRAALLAGGRYLVEAIVSDTDDAQDAVEACEALDLKSLVKAAR